jgi:hypothetical protein
MPEFIPEHLPATVTDSFVRGYLTAAEWLLDEEIDRDQVIGWAPDALTEAATECADFQSGNEADLARYTALSGRDDESAGIDFFLSRNGHGAGFFDRGDDPVFDRLQDAARVYSSADVYLGDDGLLYFNG